MKTRFAEPLPPFLQAALPGGAALCALALLLLASPLV